MSGNCTSCLNLPIMFKILFTFLAMLTLGQSFADSGLTDILFKRTATIEERKNVSEELAHLGLEQPLNVADAIAEVCYGVDLCAGNELQLPSYCEQESPGSSPVIGDPCYPLNFREKYSCNSEIEKQSYKTVSIAGKLLSDLSFMYRAYTQEYLVDSLGKQYNVDFRVLMQDPEALEKFFQANPIVKLHIYSINDESLSLAAYTLDCYGRLNSMLYSQNQKNITRYYNLYKAVINTMTLFPEFKGKVNRGAYLPANILKEHHKVGNIVCYNGFTSTAIHNPKTDMTNKPSNSFLSGKCTQRMYISYDERALGGRSISKGSISSVENEVLFEPGACFRIDNVYPRTDPPIEGNDDVECGEGEHYNFEMTLVR